MGIFGNSINIDEVVSVVILEQIQNYKKKSNAGLIFGENIFKPNVVYMDGNAEPAGCTYKFSVTLKNGKKKIVQADSGTDICDELLQKALDFETNEYVESTEPPKKSKRAPVLQKNQLPQGVYEVGKDIPAGKYDFHHVWGYGRLEVFNSKDTLLENRKFSSYIGDRYDYESIDCINVNCEEGYYVHITDNLIVSIVKSKKVEIDL